MDMAATLPRPLRPSAGPPNAPLPSLPVAKTRKSPTAISPVTPAPSRRTSSTGGSLLPAPQSAGRSVSSALPTRSPATQARTPNGSVTTGLPSPRPLNSSSSAANSTKAVKKTISAGALPPLKSASQSSSPTSTTTSPVGTTPSQRVSIGARSSSLHHSAQRRKTRSSSGHVTARRTYSSTPSLLNGGDNSKSVSLLNLPSPPQSRASSAQESYETGYTAFEDIDGEESRGREGSVGKAGSDRHGNGKDGKGNVIVSVRVRPEQAGNNGKSDLEWMVDGRRSLVSYRGREGGEYYYDNVFTVHDNNAKVYDAAAKRLVRRVMEGYHGTVFAYGMTGTGKTFSMQGTATSPGVIPLAITDIFSYIRETPHREFLLRVSYLEIYNEKIHDLLSPPQIGATGQPIQQEEIKLREDSKRGVYATPLKEEIVQSPTQLLRVIARGDNARRVAGTQYNARSSRSHAVVQIVVESRERAPANVDSKRQGIPPGGVRVSTLSLIDLAGSERAAENKERRTEGAHINKSLLTLGTVISKLSGDKEKDKTGQEKEEEKEKEKEKEKDKDKHLPYRDSKLTRLLQPALQGNSLISILCTIQIGANGSIATAQNHTTETLNTLKFASRAKNNIVSHAKKAEEAYGTAGDAGSRALLDRYRMEILELRKQLEQKDKAARDDEAEKAREQEQVARHEEQMLEMQLARTALKERIEHLNRLILSSKSLGVNNTRSFSSLSMQRASVITGNTGGDKSARSSTATLEAPQLNRSSTGSVRSNRQSPAAAMIAEEAEEEEEDSMGDNGDGTASKDAQIRALQADLADRNRYISTLEKRLLQARRSSHSRVSMAFAARAALGGDENGVETLLREKDAEITDLRARLDDKERMVSALRSAARKRDVADLTVDTTGADRRRSNGSSNVSSATALVNGHYSHGHGSHAVSGHSHHHHKKTDSSPLGMLSPGGTDKRAKSVDEMTKLLDEMITERVHNGAVGGAVAVVGAAVVTTAAAGRVDSPIGMAKAEKRRSGLKMLESGGSPRQ